MQSPPVTFTTFIISLAHSALDHPDRDLAAHTLQLLELLSEKTKGNLDEEEGHLLATIRAEITARLADKG